MTSMSNIAKNSKGLKNMALLLNLSAMYPKVIAPVIDPKSYIEIIKPF